MAKEDHGYEIEQILQREARSMHGVAELVEFRGISTEHGRAWLVVYTVPEPYSMRWVVYQQVGTELTHKGSGILS